MDTGGGERLLLVGSFGGWLETSGSSFSAILTSAIMLWKSATQPVNGSDAAAIWHRSRQLRTYRVHISTVTVRVYCVVVPFLPVE